MSSYLIIAIMIYIQPLRVNHILTSKLAKPIFCKQ